MHNQGTIFNLRINIMPDFYETIVSIISTSIAFVVVGIVVVTAICSL